jgi:shikimate dehydrogenase
MKKCYLIGYPVEHSMSAVMHNYAFKSLGLDFFYELKSVKPKDLEEFTKKELRNKDFRGGNITIPHKIQIIKHLDRIDKAAQTIGAVNTILNDDGILLGYNTDGIGALKSLKEAYGNLSRASAIVLGAGGASRSICYHLSKNVKNLTILNRTPKKAENLAIDLMANRKVTVNHGSLAEIPKYLPHADILIQTTSIGMSPNNKESLVSMDQLHRDLLVFDIVYNPIRTQLIKDSEKVGARTLTGVNMLVYQGTEAFKIWTGFDAPEKGMIEVVSKKLEEQ